MLRPISMVLDRLAQRCLALGASMLATTFESLQIAHYAEQQNQLEELARSYEAEGLTEIAVSLREKAKLLTLERPAAAGEMLLSDLTGNDHTPRGFDATAQSVPPNLGDVAGSRRLNGRPKRGKPALAAEEPAESNATAREVFFPLSPPAPTQSDEGHTG